MQAVCQRTPLQPAPICRSQLFGTVARLQLRNNQNHRHSNCGARQRVSTTIYAEDKVRETFEGAVRTGNKLADSAADLLPASVPRGAAKIGVVGVGGLLAFWLLQKILSTFLFLGLLGGGAFLWLKLSSTDKSDGGGGDSGDALADAKRIMDKYR